MEVAWLVAPELLQRWLERRAEAPATASFSTVPATASFSQKEPFSQKELCLSTSTPPRGERHSSPSSLPLALLERHPSCATEEKGGPARPLALLEWEPTQIHE